jgi:hypothetical protein
VFRDGGEIATVTSGISYDDSGLAPSTFYSYAVSAYDAAGNSSTPSAAATATTPAPGGGPTSLPLLTSADMSYLGAFRVPTSDHQGNSLTYGGHALGYNPAHNSLFFGGHDWYQLLCEVSVPPTISLSVTATVLQDCTDVTEGRLGQVDNYTVKLGGTLIYNGRLIVTGFGYYDADGSQTTSHFASGPDLSQSGDVAGPYGFNAAASPRSISGYMTPIPVEWQSLLGGPALTGQCCISIISNTSSGPAATVFDPDEVGLVDPVPGITVLYYPLSHPLAPEATQNTLFNLATQLKGVAFPSGSRSVLFFGRQGTGPYCYGTGSECSDPVDGSKGTHAYPYVHQVWAYDANELVAVKNGQKQQWDLHPYATWQLSDMDSAGSATVSGATYDPASRRVFITEGYGDVPVVHVYQVQ